MNDVSNEIASNQNLPEIVTKITKSSLYKMIEAYLCTFFSPCQR
jgi:hypothetical protein